MSFQEIIDTIMGFFQGIFDKIVAFIESLGCGCGD